jgi:hypothetical protein
LRARVNILGRAVRPALVAFILLFHLMVPWQVSAEKASRIAALMEVDGAVFVKKAGGHREFKAFKQMGLTQGDLVRTGSDGSAKIVYEDGTETSIGKYAQVMISELSADGEAKQTSIKLWAGKVWNKVKTLLNANDRFEVETPTVVIGVRGTLFFVQIDDAAGSSKVVVLDGAVGVGGFSPAAQQEPEQIVALNQQFKVNSDPDPNNVPKKEALNAEELVNTVDSKMLVQIINDVITTIEENTEKAKTAKEQSTQTGNIEQVKKSVSIAKQAAVLANTAKKLMQSVQKSPEIKQQVEQIFKRQNITLQQVVNKVEKVKQSVDLTVIEIKQNAKDAGLTDQQIEEIPELLTVEEEVLIIEQTEPMVEETVTEPVTEPVVVVPPSPQVWLTKSGNQLIVKAKDFSTEVYGIQLYMGLDLASLSGEPVNGGNQLFPADKNEANYLKTIDHVGSDDEMIFAQTLFLETSGYSFAGEKTVAVIDLPVAVGGSATVKLLDVIIVDPAGQKITSVVWSNSSITIP